MPPTIHAREALAISALCLAILLPNPSESCSFLARLLISIVSAFCSALKAKVFFCLESTNPAQVVWGLSILGHVPRNSLLESLAALLTDRFRLESGGGSRDGPSETTGGDGGGGERGADAAGGALGSSSEGREGGGRGSADAGAAGEEGVPGAGGRAGGDKDGGGHDGGGAGGETSGAVEAKAKAKAVGALTTSGTDLATAALSFAYAHARYGL